MILNFSFLWLNGLKTKLINRTHTIHKTAKSWFPRKSSKPSQVKYTVDINNSGLSAVLMLLRWWVWLIISLSSRYQGWKNKHIFHVLVLFLFLQPNFFCSCSVRSLFACSRISVKKRIWSHAMYSTTGLQVYGLFAISPWSLREKYTVCGSIQSLDFETSSHGPTINS